MTPDDLLRICQEALQTVLIVVGPIVLVSAGVAAVIAVFEAATSIQEQTIGTAARLIAVLLLLAAFGSSIGNVVHRYVERQFEHILMLTSPGRR